jgi:hypothetical protein
MSGPFIMGFNDLTQKYADDNKKVYPDKKYMTSKYKKECFKKYMKSYKKEYGYKWYMQDWYVSFVDYLWEAYKDGYEQYREYLDIEKPFLFYQYFTPRYIKRFIYRIVKRFR